MSKVVIIVLLVVLILMALFVHYITIPPGALWELFKGA